ncbi:hypothetical protein F0919_10025 [Taibaiella lutea]|uniref:Uncharacterized protein n=1 Tax=Taibaiella lutea TaxID=2608001 RepID=A0A5M6CIT0_9BACT|nr:hypothetical protein [Taibaiella lutea]KAA5534927.1 hypothetical protein F0919_10025 [Taibaiella lutea]
MGFEELIGGKNEKTMQSVLKDAVVDDEINHRVTQSAILLQISNGQSSITIRRSVIMEHRKSQLVDVFYGPQITSSEDYELRQMYLHDKGAASDELYGFHVFLEEFLGWKLPDVLDTIGNRTKLYLPLIAPAFIIEQKSGWSSFFATIPYYGVKNSEERVIEFLLNLDVFKNEQDKILLNIEKRVLQEKWTNLYSEFKRMGERSSGELQGLESEPKIINNLYEIYFRFHRNNKSYLISELINELQNEFEELSTSTETTVGANLNKNQDRLNELTTSLTRGNHRYEQMENEILLEKERLKQYIQQKKNVEEDLANNKSADKMLKLGATIQSPLSSETCPTCGQDVDGALLPSNIHQSPMKIDENISFLTSQLKMLEVFIAGQRKKILEKETTNSEYGTYLSNLRQQIRSIKRDLISDERLPSEELIERKINTRRLLALYTDLNSNIEELKKQLKQLSNDWEIIKRTEGNLAGDFFSALDREKIGYLETTFLSLLSKFNYRSKAKEAIKISMEKYVPVIEVRLPNEKPKSYDIRFDSSGSDHIRCMWAYYIALLITSNRKKGNHPMLLLFDEPQQQSASTGDFHEFLKELSLQQDSQSIVFASFQNSLTDFNAATAGINFHHIEGDGRFIKKLADQNQIDLK